MRKRTNNIIGFNECVEVRMFNFNREKREVGETCTCPVCSKSFTKSYTEQGVCSPMCENKFESIQRKDAYRETRKIRGSNSTRVESKSADARARRFANGIGF